MKKYKNPIAKLTSNTEVLTHQIPTFNHKKSILCWCYGTNDGFIHEKKNRNLRKVSVHILRIMD